MSDRVFRAWFEELTRLVPAGTTPRRRGEAPWESSPERISPADDRFVL